MGADTKVLRTRIKSVHSTLHLTKAMGLIASSKIRKANDAMTKGRAYAENLDAVLRSLTASPECAGSPYMRSGGDRTRLIIIAGDRGLAGGYNANIFRLAREYPTAEFIPLGKRACDKFGRETVSSEHFTAQDAVRLADELCADFTAGRYDRLGILCTRYVSIMTQEATVKWLFPLSPADADTRGPAVFEPDEKTILETAIPAYVAGQIIAAVRESFASEVAARRMAMDSAGKNAAQMIEDLQLQYNRARQGAITQEITEIVAGSGI